MKLVTLQEIVVGYGEKTVLRAGMIRSPVVLLLLGVNVSWARKYKRFLMSVLCWVPSWEVAAFVST